MYITFWEGYISGAVTVVAVLCIVAVFLIIRQRNKG